MEELKEHFIRLAEIVSNENPDLERLETEWKQAHKIIIDQKLVSTDVRRAKQIISLEERCMAQRANGGRCTRRRKGEKFCGTHSKNAQASQVGDTKERGNAKETTFTTIEIQGITYFTDNEKYLYLLADIMNSSPNPRIIGSYEFNEKGEPYIVD